MKKVAVVLSGCGFMDGSEIHESVACLYALEEAGVEYECIAPDIDQVRTINHVTGEETKEVRKVLVEAARISRGKIKAIHEASEKNYDAAIYPGGFGAASNLCNYFRKEVKHEVQKDVLAFAKAMAKACKPQGFVCIAPVLIPKIYGQGVELTVGNDKKTKVVLQEMGGVPLDVESGGVIVDEAHKVVSTPAYMSEKNILGVFLGVRKVVEEVLKMV